MRNETGTKPSFLACDNITAISDIIFSATEVNTINDYSKVLSITK